MLTVLTLALFIPPVQNHVLKLLAHSLSKSLHTRVEAGSVHVDFSGASLYNFYVEDQTGDTLFFAGEIDATPYLTALFSKEIDLGKIDLKDLRINLIRSSGKEDFNYQFLIDAFSGNTNTSESSSWKLNLDQLRLNSVYFRYLDAQTEMYISSLLSRADFDLRSLNTDSLFFDLNNVTIDGLRTIIRSENQENTAVSASETALVSYHIRVRKLLLENSFLSYTLDPYKKQKGINWNDLQFSKVAGDFSDVLIQPTLYYGKIDQFTFQEKSGFALTAFSAVVRSDYPAFSIDLKRVTTAHSDIGKEVFVSVPDIVHIQNTFSDIQTLAKFQDTKISFRDLYYFWPGIDSISFLKNQLIQINGELKGSLDDFSGSNLAIALNKDNQMRADFQVKHLPDFSRMHLTADLHFLRFKAEFLDKFMGQQVKSVNLHALGEVLVSGTLQGSPGEFRIALKAKTRLGNVTTRIQTAFDQDYHPVKVNGVIETQNFNPGPLVAEKSLGAVHVYVRFKADSKELSVQKGQIYSLDFNNYSYRDILFSGFYSYAKDSVYLTLDASDPKMEGSFQVGIGLKGIPVYNLRATVSYLDLQALHLFSSPLVLAGNIDVNGQGDKPDKLSLYLRATDFCISNLSYSYEMDSIIASTDLENGKRWIKANAGFFEADVKGKFTFADVPSAVQNYAHHYYTSLAQNGNARIGQVNFEGMLSDSKGLLKIFVPGMDILEGLKIEGKWDSKTFMLQTQISLDKLVFQGKKIGQLAMSLSGNSDSIAVNGSINSIIPGENFELEHFRLTSLLQQDRLKFLLHISDTASASAVDVSGLFTFRKDTFRLQIDSGNLLLRNNAWRFSGEPQLVYATDYLKMDHFDLRGEPDQALQVYSGNLVSDAGSVFAKFDNVRLAEITQLFGLSYEVSGTLNGSVSVIDPLKNPSVKGAISSDSLCIDGNLLGDVAFTARKESNDAFLHVNGKIVRFDSSVSLTGKIAVEGNTHPLDMQLTASHFPTQDIQPFLKEFIYKMEGMVSAELHVKGTLEAPEARGYIGFEGKNLIGLEATKTDYAIRDDTIRISPEAIRFDSLKIFDSQDNPAVLSGDLMYNHFRKLDFHLRFLAENFLFMNSMGKTALPFYGVIYANLDVALTGSSVNMKAHIKAKTRKGSNVFMSLETPGSSFETPEYIRFVSLDSTDTTGLKELSIPVDTVRYRLGFSKFSISGEIEVTPEATFNLVVDPVNGDKIVGSGQGSFTFKFDEENDLNLYGNYVLKSGSYSFSFLQLVHKNFIIDGGSSISWYGDPFHGILDITAAYKTKASRIALVQDQEAALSPEELRAARQPLPVTVYLKMKGDMESPDIAFDIKVPEQTQGITGSLVVQRLNQIKSDPGELNKQVLSVIAFNQFMPYQGFELQGSGQGAAGIAASSVSQLLNAQLNKLTGKINGLELQVNVQAGDQLNLQTVNLMATKKFSERVSVSIGGNLTGNQLNPQAGLGNNNMLLLGDYILFYRINSSGSINLKVFSKGQQELYSQYIQQISGASLQYKKNFDKFDKLF